LQAEAGALALALADPIENLIALRLAIVEVMASRSGDPDAQSQLGAAIEVLDRFRPPAVVADSTVLERYKHQWREMLQ
jgi:hypothetical protein